MTMTCGHNDRLWCYSRVPVTNGHGHLTRAPTPHSSPDSDTQLSTPQSSDYLHKKVARHNLAFSSMDTLTQITSDIHYSTKKVSQRKERF